MEFFSISQLASCSLDAGTKIYAVRVDCVAKDITDFSMVMTMANKKDRQEEGREEDESAQTLEDKKKKIRKVHTQSSF
jgi:Condensin complex subunit 2